MKDTTKRLLPFLLAVLLVVSIVLPADAAPSSEKIITTPTGYTKAEDVEYVKLNGYILNWGARGEDCVFLSPKAQAFYSGSNTYSSFSTLSGSKQQNQVPQSQLYARLQKFMADNHTFFTKYNKKGDGDSRQLYIYTDCMLSDSTQLSTLYRGAIIPSAWTSGATYNQEHVWPNSKCQNDKEIGDIMHLRACNPSENSSRGNDCYGENSGSNYYDPGISVRGDCARMVLYMYVRWGNTANMWARNNGKDGVMESVDILLKWMREDPVDTWEMGRNDSVQSITGTRNVFVDYPELAWLLFGQDVPANMTTPSKGKSTDAPPSGNNPPVNNNPPATECAHTTTKLVNQKAATCTEAGYTGDTVCSQCGKKLESGTSIPAGHKDSNQDNTCDACDANLCTHPESQLKNEKAATCQEEGYTGDKVCSTCGHITETGSPLPKTEHRATVIGQMDATCGTDGYSGNTVCGDCNEPIVDGTLLPATGNHSYGQWVTEKKATTKQAGLQTRSCTNCGHKEGQELPVLKPSYTWVIVTIAAAAAVCTAGVVFFILKRKK